MQPPTPISRARTRRPGNPYRVLVSILYARFSWVEFLPDGAITANTAKFARAMGLRTYRLREALAELKELGFLDRMIWHHGWFLARPTSPAHFARIVADMPEPPGPQIRGPAAFDRAMAVCEAIIEVEAELSDE